MIRNLKKNYKILKFLSVKFLKIRNEIRYLDVDGWVTFDHIDLKIFDGPFYNKMFNFFVNFKLIGIF